MGAIKLGIANALPTGTALSVTGTLDLAGFGQQVASVTGSGTVTDSGAAATFTVNNAGADTFAGTIAGANLSLTKTGAGTLTLTSANTYGGATTISAGTIANGAGYSFLVNGPQLGRDGALLGAGIAIQFNECLSTYLYYDGDLGRTNYQSTNVTGGLRITF